MFKALLSVSQIRQGFRDKENNLHRLDKSIERNRTMKNFSKKDYWGTHALENRFANEWTKKSFQLVVNEVEKTFRESTNILEFQAACWTLIKLGSWFHDMFDFRADYNFAIRKIKKILESEVKIFEDAEDNISFRKNFEQQLKDFENLKKDYD